MTRKADVTRQALVLTAALAQTALPAVLSPAFLRDEPPPMVMQPATYAFLVWTPIFGTSIAYGLSQARPSRTGSPVDAAVGWPLAAAFACTAAWAPLVATRRHVAAQTALIGLAVLGEVARRRVARLETAGTLPTSDQLTLVPSAAMLSAWGSAAAVVNLTALMVGRKVVRPGRPAEILGATATAAAGAVLTWSAATSPGGRRTLTSRIHSATSAWAFAGIAVGQRKRSRPIAVTAAAAAALLVAVTLAA